MRRLIVGLVVALLSLGAFVGVGTATHNNGQGPDKDFVNGTVKGPLGTPLGTFPSQTHINAQSDSPTGASGRGTFWTNIFDTPFGTVTIRGDIVCLNAFGNVDLNRGVITESNTGLAPVGFGVIGSQIDNGEGSKDPPDQNFGALTGPPPTSCPPLTISGPPMTQGNITVHDGI
jgi:hypothetical protein